MKQWNPVLMQGTTSVVHPLPHLPWIDVRYELRRSKKSGFLASLVYRDMEIRTPFLVFGEEVPILVAQMKFL